MNFEMKSGRLVFFSSNKLRRVLENLGHEVIHHHDPVDTNPFIQIRELPAAGPESNLQSSPAQPTKDETQS